MYVSVFAAFALQPLRVQRRPTELGRRESGRLELDDDELVPDDMS